MRSGSWEGFLRPQKTVEELGKEKAAEEALFQEKKLQEEALAERALQDKIEIMREEANRGLTEHLKSIPAEKVKTWEESVSEQANFGKYPKKKPPSQEGGIRDLE